MAFCNQKEEVTDTDLHIFNNVTQISINDDEADSNPLTEAERIRLKNLLKNSE
ncbi:MAG: hypothetical protein K6E76_04710 [Patescibacteria group bacterium]|nr:hypothetical protein [Patescibacteria group bacterium]